MKNYPLHERILSALVAIFTLGYSLILRAIHADMNKGIHYPLVYCSYSTFKRKFDQISWGYDPEWKTSLFSQNHGPKWNDNFIHADICRINGVNHILSSWGLLRFKIYKHFYIRKRFNTTSSKIYE